MVLRVFSLRIERYPSIVSFRGTDEVALTARVAVAPAASAKLAGDAVKVTLPAPSSGVTLTLKESEPEPTLVTTRLGVLLKGVPGVRAPKLMETGETVAGVLSAAAASSNPFPCASTRGVAPRESATTLAAVLTSADLIWAGVKLGSACFTRAAAPATRG